MKIIHKYQTEDHKTHDTYTQAVRHLESIISTKFKSTFDVLKNKTYTESMIFVKENIVEFNQIMKLFNELTIEPEIED